HLPRPLLRRAVALLPVLVRPEPRLEPRLLAGPRDLGLLRQGGREVRPAITHPLRRGDRERPLRGRPLADPNAGRRRGRGGFPRLGLRGPPPSSGPGRRRASELLGRRLPLGPLGSRRRAARQADRRRRNRLAPDYEPMCTRLVVSSGFYGAMQRPGVELETAGIERVEPAGLVTSDGKLHEVDVIVFATGFDSHAYVRPMELVGEDGITL